MSPAVPAPHTDPMRLLADGVPLTLLLDLALGPFSEDLLEHEPVLPRQRHHAAQAPGPAVRASGGPGSG